MVPIGSSRRYKGVSFMSSLTIRCLRAVPPQFASSLFRQNDLQLTAGLGVRCVGSGCGTKDKLSEAVTSSDMASVMRWTDDNVLDTPIALAANVNSPPKPLRDGMDLMKDCQVLAEGLTEMFATNRNARRPKKANHGKRPCSNVGRRYRRRRQPIIRNGPP